MWALCCTTTDLVHPAVLNHAVGLAISAADLTGVHITFGQDDARVDSRAVLIDITAGVRPLRCAELFGVECSRLLDCLAIDFARLRAVVPTDPSAAVPSCPGWTVADLTRHPGEVYLH
jgi:hypothetical protein